MYPSATMICRDLFRYLAGGRFFLRFIGSAMTAGFRQRIRRRRVERMAAIPQIVAAIISGQPIPQTGE
jgi:hypothetical protein